MLGGTALGCDIPDVSKWDRKSYYYPDLPKNYQISQFDRPVCFDGAFDVPVADASGNAPDFDTKRIRITRAHLEEDAGKLLHDLPGGGFSDGSLVDLNRAGTPLLEIVTEPDFTSADEAVAFGQALRDVCRHLGVTEGIMQKGHMRFEPNINVLITKPSGEVFATPVVEIKNLNSFKAVHGAIVHEHHRQIEQWLEDGRVMGARAKSTRGWDDVKLVTTPQREKEDADEYRYFPAPDLLPLEIEQAWVDDIAATLPELPDAKKARFMADFGLTDYDASVLTAEVDTAAYFENVAEGRAGKAAANWVINELFGRLKKDDAEITDAPVSPAQLGGIIDLIARGDISGKIAKDLFDIIYTDGGDPAEVVEARGMKQVTDTGAIEAAVDDIIAANPAQVEKARENPKLAGWFVGQVMKATGGKANPKAVNEIVAKKLSS